MISLGLGNTITTVTGKTLQNGNWKGIMSGAFNGDIHTEPYTIVFDSKMNGTYEGQIYGDWVGTYYVNYEIFPLGIKEYGDGDIEGNYTVNIDESGVMFLDGIAMIKGVLQGKLEFETEQIELGSEYLARKWNGIATIKRIVTRSFDLPTNMKILVYGEFKENGTIEATPPQEELYVSTSLETPNVKNLSESPTQNQVILSTDRYVLHMVIVVAVMFTLIGAYIYKIKCIRQNRTTVTTHLTS